MKKIAISQSNYIPWLGYFLLIESVDEFIFFDEVQYTRRDWRNRNKIISGNDVIWLTIPIKSKGNYKEKISSIVVNDESWIEKHLQKIKINYSKSKYFDLIYPKIYKLYKDIKSNNLSDINQKLIINISKMLGIKTIFKKSSNFKTKFINNKDPNLRLIEICKDTKAKYYYTGPNAKNYIKEKVFLENKIKIIWFNYEKNFQIKKNNNYSTLSIIDHLMKFGLK
jgi:hypothetical protein